MDLANFRVDLTIEEEGRWVPIGEGAKIKVASINCESYKKGFKEIKDKHKAEIRTNSLNEDDYLKITARLLADHILKDWEGVEIDGVPTPYSPDKAYEILCDNTYKELRFLVEEISGESILYRENALALQEKKSQTG